MRKEIITILKESYHEREILPKSSEGSHLSMLLGCLLVDGISVGISHFKRDQDSNDEEN